MLGRGTENAGHGIFLFFFTSRDFLFCSASFSPGPTSSHPVLWGKVDTNPEVRRPHMVEAIHI